MDDDLKLRAGALYRDLLALTSNAQYRCQNKEGSQRVKALTFARHVHAASVQLRYAFNNREAKIYLGTQSK
jgi:hypothetical protein